MCDLHKIVVPKYIINFKLTGYVTLAEIFLGCHLSLSCTSVCVFHGQCNIKNSYYFLVEDIMLAMLGDSNSSSEDDVR